MGRKHIIKEVMQDSIAWELGIEAGDRLITVNGQEIEDVFDYRYYIEEEEILLLIDEAQLLFNSREWQNISRQGWLSFFSQHRHYGYDVILVAQFDRMLDRQVRCLIEYEEVHRKVSRFGYIGFFVGLLTGDNLYVAVKRWHPIKERVEGSFFVGSKKLFAIYDSYSHFDTPGQGQRVSGEKRGPAITLPLPPEEPKGEKKEEEDSGLEFIDLDKS